MDKVVKEGQTQVYADGSIDPQFGVDTNKPYLHQPPKQEAPPGETRPCFPKISNGPLPV